MEQVLLTAHSMDSCTLPWPSLREELKHEQVGALTGKRRWLLVTSSLGGPENFATISLFLAIGSAAVV